MISTTLTDWVEEHAIDLKFIQLGKPTQNSYVEQPFNRIYVDELLNMYVFKTLSEVRAIIEELVDQYNEERVHDGLDSLRPFEYRMAHQ